MKLFLVSIAAMFTLAVNGQTTDSIVLNNAVLYYYTYGTGKPIVVLSGGPGVASHQEDDVAIELGKKYRVILFDQRGTGKSWTKPFDTTTINLKQAVADLESLRLHLKLNQLALYGHSWGSMLGTAYIASHPDRVKLFVSVGGGEIDTELTPMVNENVDARVQLGDTLKYMYWMDSARVEQDPSKAAMEMRKLGVARSVYDTAKLDLVFQQVLHGDRNRSMSSLMWRSVRRELHFLNAGKKFKGPTLVVFGWNDMIGLTTAPQYKQAFPQAELKGIFRSGHYPEVEQPAAFYKVVLDFLAKNL